MGKKFDPSKYIQPIMGRPVTFVPPMPFPIGAIFQEPDGQLVRVVPVEGYEDNKVTNKNDVLCKNCGQTRYDHVNMGDHDGLASEDMLICDDTEFEAMTEEEMEHAKSCSVCSGGGSADLVSGVSCQGPGNLETQEVRKEVRELSERMPQIGDVVVYCDTRGQDHNALVQIVWGPKCVNLLFLTDDEKRKDGYGRQSLHETSVAHAAGPGTAHGRYWRWPDEPVNEYRPPSAV